MFGRYLLHQNSNLVRGELHKNIALPDDIPGGIYILQVKNEEINENLSSSRSLLVTDRYDNKVFLFENDFALRWFQDKNPDVKLYNPMDAEDK